MSVKAMAWAWEQEGLAEGEKLLLMAIADHADDKGTCWPGQVGLANKCGITDRTVRTRLKKLEALGLLAREPRYNAEGKRTSDRLTLRITTGKSFHRKTLPPEAVASREPSVPCTTTGVVSKAIGGSTATGTGTATEVAEPPDAAPNRTPPLKVDGLKLSTEEWQMAQVILTEFNENAGTRFSLVGGRGRPTEHLKRIVGRVRENPEVPVEKHLEVIRHTFQNPWWGKSKPTGVGVVYGPQAFLRCLAMEQPANRNFADERAPGENMGW